MYYRKENMQNPGAGRQGHWASVAVALAAWVDLRPDIRPW